MTDPPFALTEDPQPARDGSDELPEHHHRNIQSGGARAAVFGLSDGLVTNVALILGVAGAHASVGMIRLAGVTGLVSGMFSMATGEYLSMRAQRELLERELEVERREIHRPPHAEHRELTRIYQARGLDPELASQLAQAMMADPEIALETHAREELGLDPSMLGSPILAAVSSLISFGLGALLPLLPWFFAATHSLSAVIASVAIGIASSIGLGLALGILSGRSPLRSAARQLFLTALSAAITTGIGHLVGLSVHGA